MTQTNLIHSLARRIIDGGTANSTMVATAESCTGGMVVAALTDIAGSSAVMDRGFVTYTNEAKNEMLGVPRSLIEKHGAVSREVAGAMAHGAINKSNAALAVSITGIAGPSGGSADKPVGLVWFGLANKNGILKTECRLFAQCSRAVVRAKATQTALILIANGIKA